VIFVAGSPRLPLGICATFSRELVTACRYCNHLSNRYLKGKVNEIKDVTVSPLYPPMFGERENGEPIGAIGIVRASADRPPPFSYIKESLFLSLNGYSGYMADFCGFEAVT
jgi:hypothetical protein